MKIDFDVLAEMHANQYMTVADEHYGRDGTECVNELIREIKKLYGIVAPESFSCDKLVFFRSVSAESPEIEGDYNEVYSTEHISRHINIDNLETYVIQALPSRSLRIWRKSSFDHEQFSSRTDTVVYVLSQEAETFCINGTTRKVSKPVQASASGLVPPTFRHLQDALQKYAQDVIKHSSDRVFGDAWHQPERLFFSSSPEWRMRESLSDYLKITLRDVAEVRQEQSTSETDPIDVKVSWAVAERLALIEIKWMGKSINSAGTSFGNVHNAARANEGARQLVRYLENNNTSAPHRQTFGYLVVIDARRWGLNENSTSIGHADGYHYENKEVDYYPEYHNIRDDFRDPIRMFATPRCS